MITIHDLKWARKVGETQAQLMALGLPKHINTHITTWVEGVAKGLEAKQNQELEEIGPGEPDRPANPRQNQTDQ